VLADINGLPMVVATAKRVEKLDRVAIATDSQEVIKIAHDHGYEAIITREDHNSGTDRINEAAHKLGLGDDEVIINVQADEPFIEPGVVKIIIDRVYDAMERGHNFMMASCYRKMDREFATDPNHVKVIVNHADEAIYFSRSKIPYDREEHHAYFGHLGVYGFTKSSLESFCALPPSPLENIEKLEQLRAIYWGHKVLMSEVESASFGIDTKEDLEKALNELY
jgi:3-deoxy-manno-octulosonate cytidylyltransferase (CMP-KDO synthetase)